MNIEWDLEEWELVNEIAISKWGEEEQLFFRFKYSNKTTDAAAPAATHRFKMYLLLPIKNKLKNMLKERQNCRKRKKNKQRLTGFFDKRMFSSKFIQSSDLFI